MWLECYEPRTNSESRCPGELNRHPAVNILNDRINIEGLGSTEWLRCTKPNKRFDRSGNSAAFIRQLEGLIHCVPPGQSRR
jgi:hypothetical protein